MANTTPIILGPSAYTTDLESELTEDLQWYGPGKLHPTHLGDTLSSGRYTIMYKLDHSNDSLSWLARDKATATWRRIDIIPASPEATKFHADAVERDLIERATDTTRADAQGLALEYFYHRGPNGDHLCVVFPLEGGASCFRWTVPGGGRDRTEMSAAWFVRQCAKLCKERNNDGDNGEKGEAAPVNVHAITAKEMLAILGRPRLIEVTPELRELAAVDEDVGDDQVPRYLVLRPADRGGF